MIVVVLGHRLKSSAIHDRLRARVERGMDAYRAEGASKLFFTGGQSNPDVDRTECGVMGEYAVRRGFDPDRLVLEPFAEDTIGNAYFTRVLADDVGLDVDEVGLVTDDYHVRRATYAFEQCFGPEVAVREVDAVETETDPDSSTCRRKLRQTRSFFESVDAGDVDAIRRRLHADHDCYDFSETVHAASP